MHSLTSRPPLGKSNSSVPRPKDSQVLILHIEKVGHVSALSRQRARPCTHEDPRATKMCSPGELQAQPGKPTPPTLGLPVRCLFVAPGSWRLLVPGKIQAHSAQVPSPSTRGTTEKTGEGGVAHGLNCCVAGRRHMPVARNCVQPSVFGKIGGADPVESTKSALKCVSHVADQSPTRVQASGWLRGRILLCSTQRFSSCWKNTVRYSRTCPSDKK